MNTLSDSQATALEYGNVIRDDVLALVLSVNNYPGETVVFLEDVNGQCYHMRYAPTAILTLYPRREWEALRYPVDFTPSVPETERERMEAMYDRIHDGY